MKPLYCYRLNEYTGDINKYKITNYEYRTVFGHKKAIFYSHSLGNKTETNWTVYTENLDELVHMKLHTFVDDDIIAYKLISDQLEEKWKKASQEYYKWGELYDKVKEKW